MTEEKPMLEMTADDTRIGTILNGRYKIIDKIAAGGMAVVYRGERLELERPVAIKFLQEVMLQNPKFITRFESEARAMSKLSHPYCVSVIDFGVEGAPYIVMDYVEGETMKALLRKERVSVARAITLTRQILAGIAHAHSQGIVHRDIKPENIMLQDVVGVGEQVRIFDFGLAKMMDHSPGMSLEHSSLVAGTPNYMSPEQSRGGKIDERTDLYSICVVFFELLTGRKPFIHDDFLEVVRMHRETTPPNINEITVELSFSVELEALVAKALSKDPKDRFQTAEEFSAALDATPEGKLAKELEASVRPDPKAKTLPVGTMTPFEHLGAMGGGKKVSLAPTTSLRAEASAEESAAEASVNTATTSSDTRGDASRSSSRSLRGWFFMMVVGAVLAFTIVFYWWPADSGDVEKEDTANNVPPSTKGVADKRKEKVKPSKKERGAGAAAAAQKQQATKKEETPPPQPAVAETSPQAAEDQVDEAEDDNADDEPIEDSLATKMDTMEAAHSVESPASAAVKSIADVKQLLKEGKKDAAISGLQKLRREQPRNAHIVFMLANLYYERDWLSDALEHYREAIRLDASYRKRSGLIRNVIDMFKVEKLGKKAMQVVQKNIGKAALPQLRRAAKKDKSYLVKRRAATVIKKIQGK